jgi:hypothetical protein
MEKIYSRVKHPLKLRELSDLYRYHVKYLVGRHWKAVSCNSDEA